MIAIPPCRYDVIDTFTMNMPPYAPLPFSRDTAASLMPPLIFCHYCCRHILRRRLAPLPLPLLMSFRRRRHCRRHLRAMPVRHYVLISPLSRYAMLRYAADVGTPPRF